MEERRKSGEKMRRRQEHKQIKEPKQEAKKAQR
jgi:hypothetical protein